MAPASNPVSQRPPTPRPVQRTFLTPAVAILAPEPRRPIIRNPDIPLINQANTTEPVFPSLAHESLDSQRTLVEVDEDDLPHALTVEPLYCFYPEYLYLGTSLPTRKPAELTEFLRHCQIVLSNNSGAEIHLNHPLSKTRQVTSSSLNFENLLWKSHTLVLTSLVIEEYQWIRRLARAHRPDKAYLEPAYKVMYYWNQEGWTVTRFFGNTRTRE
jgi:hypothetical protein